MYQNLPKYDQSRFKEGLIMKTVASQIQAGSGKEIYTYIAIPIESIKQNLEFGTQSLEMTPNVILNVLSEDLTCEKLQTVTLPQTLSQKLTKNSRTLDSYENEREESPEVRPTVIEHNNHNLQIRKSVISTTNRTCKFKASELFKCDVCGEVKKLTDYRKHAEFHRNEKKFKCQQCSSSYNIEDNLKLHMVTHSKGVPTCPICKRVFQRLASLKAHIINHEVEETFTCVECLAEFEKEEEFNKHIVGHINETHTKSSQKSLVCAFCGLQFKEVTEFKEHVSYHMKVKKLMTKGRKRKRRIKCNKDLPHKCEICTKAFSKFCLLERHSRIHTGEKPFACHLCDRAFTQKGTLQIHLARHAGIKPFQCTLCPAKFCQKGNLRVHVQKTHILKDPEEKIYKCAMCTCIFKRVSSLNAHITRSHASSDQDQEDISLVLDQLKELEKQIDSTKNKETGSQIKRQFLTEIFKESDFGTIKHVKLVDSSIEGTLRQYLVKQRKVGDCYWYLCSYCGKEFKKPSDLIRHIRVHTREKPFKCKQCDQAFSLKSTLSTHISTHIDKRCYKCVICSKTFTSMGTLNAHLRRHDKNAAKTSEQYVCNMCNKVFNSATRAKLHIDEHNLKTESTLNSNLSIQLKQPMMETANGLVPVVPPRSKTNSDALNLNRLRPHKCHCGATFTKAVHLKRHMLIHSEERKFKCTSCSKSFYSSYALNEHFKFHIGERKFGCKVCGKKFVTNAILKRHNLVHSSLKPYVCPYCRKRFKTVLLCRKHILIHKRDLNIQYRSLNETEEISKDPTYTENTIDETLPDNLFATSDATDDIYNVGLNFENELRGNSLPDEATSTVSNSKILFADKKNGIIISASLEETQGGREENDQGSSTLDQQLYSNYIDSEKMSETIVPSNLDNMEDAMTNMVQENSTVFINFDDLQALATSNLYNGCYSQFKNIDPLLMNEMNEIQDSNILFSTDGLSLSDNQLDQQALEGLIPFAFGSNLTLNTAGNSFPNIVLSSVVENEGDVQIINEAESAKEVINEETTSETTPPISASLLENPSGSEDVIPEDEALNLDRIYDSVDFTCSACKQFLRNVQDLMNHDCKGIPTNETDAVRKTGSDEDAQSSGVTLNTEVQCEDAKEQVYKCTRCTKTYCNKNALDYHVRTHKSKKSDSNRTCSYCGKFFKKRTDLERHIRTHTGEKPYNCSKCTKSFSLKSTLDSHLHTHNPGGNKDFNCAVCSSYFSSKSSLRVHMTMHTGVKPYQCTMCSEKFRTPGHRKSHMANHLKYPNRKPNLSKIAKVNNLLQSVIMDTHQSLEQTQNENVLLLNEPNSLRTTEADLALQESDVLLQSQTIQVDSLFLQQLQLNNVLLDDTSGEIPSFIQVDINNDGQITNVKSIIDTQESLLEEKLQTNIVEVPKKPIDRNFECDVCHKKYTTKSVLTKHKKIHNNLKCTICDIEFYTKDSLNEHLKLHNNMRSIPCPLCANTFNLKRDLKTHMKRIHDVTVVQT